MTQGTRPRASYRLAEGAFRVSAITPSMPLLDPNGHPFFLQAVLNPELFKPASEVLAPIAVAVAAWFNRRGENKTRDSLSKRIDEHNKQTETRFDTIDLGIRDLRGIVIGPDGRNGLRQRIEEIRDDVKEISSNVTAAAIAAAVVDERSKRNDKRIDEIEKRERDQ